MVDLNTDKVNVLAAYEVGEQNGSVKASTGPSPLEFIYKSFIV